MCRISLNAGVARPDVGPAEPMDSPIIWAPAPDRLTLPPASLHIWRASLDVLLDSLAHFSSVLSLEERARAERFVFERDRQHFQVARATLRLLLGRYLQISPHAVEFEAGPQNKPYLAKHLSTSRLQFNLSHSHGVALFAFAAGRELGIDLEKIRPDFASRDIAERYFAPKEIAELGALPPSEYTLGFFLCWTRKEAYIKARGEGLRLPLDSFSVSLTPRGPAELRSMDSNSWSIYSFCPAKEYVAAAVVEGQGSTLEFFDCIG
jgi:4'-phosphopantetheinyl transferase